MALAGMVRSNGVLGVWFLVWFELVMRREKRGSGVGERDWDWDWGWMRRLARVVGGGVGVGVPYVWMQVVGWRAFCDGDISVSGRVPAWCGTASRVAGWGGWMAPLATVASGTTIYGYVQKTYWDVGFLNFYEKLARLPFVVQSIPVLVLAVGTCWAWTFGPWTVVKTNEGRSAAMWRLLSLGRKGLDAGVVEELERRKRVAAVIVEPLVAPFVYHLALMTSVAIFVMHVNVATRFLSSSPLLFWGVASWVLNGDRGERGGVRWRIVLVWCASYLLVGTLMFVNFWPWV